MRHDTPRRLGTAEGYKSVDNLSALQQWYLEQCNGDWEHEFGVDIETLDNPGWSLSIDLIDTALENKSFTEVSESASEADWICCKVEKRRFKGRCGPKNLERMISIFLQWANQSP